MSGSRPARTGRSRPAGVMVTAVVGIVVIAAYVALAALTGRLSPADRRALLDGFGPPPAYRWVRPPAALAAENKQPLAGTFNIDAAPGSGSQPGVFSTKDFQATIVLSQGAIPAAQGLSSVTLTITPMDPTRFPPAPAGRSITGNVYLFQAKAEPAGSPIGALEHPGDLSLAYPTSSTSVEHTLLFSPDGKAWQVVAGSVDTAPQQQVGARVSRLGYFAVEQARVAGATPSKGNALPTIVIAVVVGAIALAIGTYELRDWRRRRARRRSADRRAAGRARRRSR